MVRGRETRRRPTTSDREDRPGVLDLAPWSGRREGDPQANAAALAMQPFTREKEQARRTFTQVLGVFSPARNREPLKPGRHAGFVGSVARRVSLCNRGGHASRRCERLFSRTLPLRFVTWLFCLAPRPERKNSPRKGSLPLTG